MENRILVVDDEPEIADLVTVYLRGEGFQVFPCGSGAEALTVLGKEKIDLAVLDVMLPDGDGFALLEQLRRLKGSGFPVIFLSARDEDSARLRGLGLGADDYITKPFLPEELLLRVKAVLRRTYHLDDEAGTDRIGSALVDWGAGTICTEGESYMLTAKEYVLLKKLCENRGRILSMNVLCDTLWPDGSYGYENSLMVHIRHLREKPEIDRADPRYLKVAWGQGYKIEGSIKA